MEALKTRWHDLNDKANNLSVRERAILFATLLVLILFVWLQFALTPMQEENKHKLAQLNQANEDIANFASQLAELQVQLEKNPNDPLRKEQKELKASLEQLAGQIAEQLSDLMPPQKMAEAMQEVLSDYQGLKLKKARNLPVTPLKLASSAGEGPENGESETDQNKDPEAVIFVHGFEMELEGEYFQTLNFIQRLEAMDGFYWQALEYDVQSYPKASIILQLNTLSLEEEWIGV